MRAAYAARRDPRPEPRTDPFAVLGVRPRRRSRKCARRGVAWPTTAHPDRGGDERGCSLRRANGRTLGIVNPASSAAAESQLSGRELEVLSYMPTQLSAREIAETLHVSLNTVKSHMQSVYRKLGCDSREAAVERARRLHLLR